ncbi:glycosyltransferase [Chryseolinea sp. T2]|uniref:glycosyltransferase family 4 protein n=1 Tax=Chryseolinea sp. T2 TaxID=3129255 RepID=UPI0030787498
MRVLMFGWEFPPHISGGLGTACEGLTLALNKADIDILFVVPKVYGDEKTPFSIVSASEVPIYIRSPRVSLVSEKSALDSKSNDQVRNIDFRKGEVRVMSPSRLAPIQTTDNQANHQPIDVNGADSDLPPFPNSTETGDHQVSNDTESDINEGLSWRRTIQTIVEQSERKALEVIAVYTKLVPYAPPEIIPNRSFRIEEVEGLPSVSETLTSGPYRRNTVPKVSRQLERIDKNGNTGHYKVVSNNGVAGSGSGELTNYTGSSESDKDGIDVSSSAPEVFIREEFEETPPPDPGLQATQDSIQQEEPNFYPFSGRYDRDLLHEVLRYADVADELASTHSFDVIHAHDWMTFDAGIAAKRKSGKKLVLHVHATEIDRSGSSPNPEIFSIERRGLMQADQVISVSNWTKQTLIKHYGLDGDKITVVHNGIINTDAPIKKAMDVLKVPIVSFAGRITYQKGPLYFVEAAFKVLQKFPNVHFVMAGSGDQLSSVIDQVSHLRMDRHFSFTGFLKEREIEQLWSMTSVYVMPSVSEPFGITPLEAIRAGVPVIVSRQAGVSEVMPHAMKIDFWNTDELANAICSVIAYPKLASTLASNARQELKNLSWGRAALLVKSLYEKVRQ